MRESLVRHLFALALICVVPASLAEDWDRGDRYEGIRPQNIHGSDFELLGIHVEPGPLTRGAERLQLLVPLGEPTELRVRVWEPESGYTMIPKRTRFEPGERFSWPRGEVLARHEPPIYADQLFVLATDPLETLYFPARLTTSRQPPLEVESYVFSFRSRGGVGVDVLIAREERGRLTPVLTDRRDERYGGLLAFPWDGREASGSVAPSGIYHLKLHGKVYLQSDRDVNVDVRFVHHGEVAP